MCCWWHFLSGLFPFLILALFLPHPSQCHSEPEIELPGLFLCSTAHSASWNQHLLFTVHPLDIQHPLPSLEWSWMSKVQTACLAHKTGLMAGIVLGGTPGRQRVCCLCPTAKDVLAGACAMVTASPIISSETGCIIVGCSNPLELSLRVGSAGKAKWHVQNF